MLTKLMGKHRGVEPIEGKLAAVHHFHHRVEHLGFFPDLVFEAKKVASLGQAQRFG